MDLREVVACSALFLAMLYFFDLIEVFIEPSSSLNRFVVISASTTGVILMLFKLPLALRVLRIAWPWMLVVAWFAMTTWWAGYPDLSRTRVLAFAAMCIGGLGIAVGFRSPRTLTATLVTAFGFIVLADLVSLDFDDSYTEIGVRGIHTHKNAAGFLASATIVTSRLRVSPDPLLRFPGRRRLPRLRRRRAADPDRVEDKLRRCRCRHLLGAALLAVGAW